jgi:hypothetical protein
MTYQIPEKVSELLRETAKNNSTFLNHVADYIEHLEENLDQLQQQNTKEEDDHK